MRKAIPSKKWLTIFLGILLMLVFMIGLTAYWIDPFYQFRYENRTYFNNSAKFLGPGLVKNYSYDTLILGSSMTQNFDMEMFRQELGVTPLHIGIGGMGIDELLSYIELSEQTGKCESYYICIDQYMLADAIEYRTPEYLFNDDPLALLRYLFCYEAWFRYIPLDIVLSIINQMPINMPPKLLKTMDIDYLGNWENDYVFGEDSVIQNYLHNNYNVSPVEIDGLYARMTQYTDKIFDSLPGDKDRYNFFFPPYSVLFWYDAQNNGYLEAYLEIKQYFLEKAHMCGIDVYDFQSAEYVFDLENYRDMTHYRGEINDWMVNCFTRGECLANRESIKQGNAYLITRTEIFADTYHYLLAEAKESD